VAQLCHKIHIITYRRLPGLDYEHHLIDIVMPVERRECCRVATDVQLAHVVPRHHVSPPLALQQMTNGRVIELDARPGEDNTPSIRSHWASGVEIVAPAGGRAGNADGLV
jgi:hypothetical protein